MWSLRLLLFGRVLDLDDASLYLLELWHQGPPHGGQLDPAGAPVEERAAQLRLELPDRAGQRRLRDIACLGGTREIQLASDREEIADLVELHDGCLPSVICKASCGVDQSAQWMDAALAEHQYAIRSGLPSQASNTARASASGRCADDKRRSWRGMAISR